MSDLKKIKSALISVYHKDGLDELITKLDKLGVKFYSTGGTKDFIEGLLGGILIFAFMIFIFWFTATFMYDMV